MSVETIITSFAHAHDYDGVEKVITPGGSGGAPAIDVASDRRPKAGPTV